jgi:SprB repeat
MIYAKYVTYALKNLLLPYLLLLTLCLGGLPSHAQSSETFPAGSFIINMGITPQNVNNGLRPYGMIYDLLKNNSVPIYWVINPSKGKDGIDFTHNGINYQGGAFIIPAQFRTAAVNARITYWTAPARGVVGATSVAPLTLPVNKILTAAPRWTLDKKNGSIAAKYFVNASIDATAHGGSDKDNWKDPSELGACDDVFAMPHAEPLWNSHSNLLTWNSVHRGYIYLGCAAGGNTHGLFNPSNRPEQLNFLAGKTGTATGGGPSTQNSLYLPSDGSRKVGNGDDYAYDHHSDPVMQFIGSLDGATRGGAQQIYMPLSPGWYGTTKVGVYNSTNNLVTSGAAIHRAAALAFGPAFGNTNNGQVLMIGGHDITTQGSSTEQIAAQRAFFNFSFGASADKTPSPTMVGLPPVSIAPGIPVNLSYTLPSGANPATYTTVWSASCGGTFSPSNTSASVTFTPSAVVGSVTCNITVKVTDPCGRESFDTKPITVQCAINVGTTIIQPCGVSSNGSVSLNITNGTAPYAYTWTRTEGGTGNGTGTLISGLAAGTYQITVTAANGCASTISRTLTTSPSINVTATPVSVLCNGGATGSINVSASGGTPGFTYLWADGPTTQNRSGLLAGNYSLNVTDTRGCTGTANATVAQPALISATPTITPANCFGQASGAISLALSGGTSPYTFLWNDGATNQNRTGLATGTYSVVITDIKGCTLAVNSLVVTQPAAALSLTTSVVNVNCNGINNGSATVSPTGGTAPYTYNWNGTPTGDGTATITGLGAGSYPVTVTDARGCTSVTTAIITEQSPLTVSAVFVRPTCPPGTVTLGNDGSITLTVNGGTAPRTYAWTASGGGIVPPGQNANQNLTLLVAGTYSVTITDANSCTATTSVILTNINPNPVAPGVIKSN